MFNQLFSESLTYSIGWVIFHSLWQAVVIAILTGVLLIVFRKKSSAFKYTLTNVALWSVMVAALVTFFYYNNLYHQPVQASFSAIEKQVTVTVNNTLDNQPVMVDASDRIMSWDNFKNYINRNIYLIVTLWLLGASLFIIRLIGGVGYVYYLKSKMNFPPDEYWIEVLEKLQQKSGIKKTVSLVESALVRTPIVVGFLKPMILFPIGAINRLNTNEVEAILAHELAHILRNDYVYNILQSIIEALFYYHPAVWWLSAQIRVERENCCDDKAIEWCGNSLTYAKSLVSVQEMAYYSPQLSLAFSGKRKNALIFRVQRILNQPQNKSYILEKLVATCLIFSCLIAISFAGNVIRHDDSTFKMSTFSLNQNTESVDYLRYLDAQGKLDSLPIDADIKDGHYSINDHLHSLELTVKDRSVVQFNLNGLEVPPSKIANFEGLIMKALHEGVESPQTLSSSTKFDSPQDKNTVLADNNGLTINIHSLKEENENSDFGAGNSYSDSYNPDTEEGEISTEVLSEKVEKLQSEIKNLNKDKVNATKIEKIKKSLKSVNGRINDDLSENELQELNIQLEGLDKQLEKLHSDLSNINFTFSIDKAGKDKGFLSYGISTNDKDKAQKLLIEQLVKDGIAPSGNIHFSINRQNMMVNDKVYTGNVLKKYHLLIESVSGKPFDDQSMMAFNVHTVKGKFESCVTAPTPPTPPTPEVSSSNNSRPFNALIKQLIEDGRIQYRQMVKIYMTEDYLKVDGKKLSDSEFEPYKILVFKELKSISALKISFVGRVLSSKNDFVEISGSLTQDFQTDDK